jgi:hypothetical protein
LPPPFWRWVVHSPERPLQPKIPEVWDETDLIGIKDRKYLDHTATHLRRGVGDLMRYAALVSFADAVDFSSYHVLSPGTRRVQARLPDEALYIYSLGPPPNPNPNDDNATAGERIFARERCAAWHTPPLYTNTKRRTG